MAEWLYEEGIGENRAVLVAQGEIVEAEIEHPGTLRAGGVFEARLRTILIPGRRAVAELQTGEEVLVEPAPRGVSENARCRIEILREAIPEAGRPKHAKGRATEEAARAGPGLFERLNCQDLPVRLVGPHEGDLLERAGWSELLDEAASGEIAFAGGGLRMSLTPAMTLFDVDGATDPSVLAVTGAEAAAKAIRRHGITGSIGIDLPTVTSKDARQKAAAAVDAILPQPFERTAVNGFGFLQIVRRRLRPSLPEMIRADQHGAAARALMRLAERTPGHGARTIVAAPAVIAMLERHPQWLESLSRRTGTPIALQGDAGLAISAGHVHSHFA